MKYTTEDVDSTRFQVNTDKWIDFIHISSGDVLTLDSLSNSQEVVTVSSPIGRKITLSYSEFEELIEDNVIEEI